MKKLVHLFLATGFEEVEALATVDLLRRANLEVLTVSISKEPAVVGAHHVTVIADTTIDKLPEELPDALVLPGGLPGAQNLHDCAPLMQRIRKQLDNQRLVAAICASPAFILGEEGLLKGKNATCYPGCEAKMKDATVMGDMVTQDGNIITGKGPAASFAFALTIIRQLMGEAVQNEVAQGFLYR